MQISLITSLDIVCVLIVSVRRNVVGLLTGTINVVTMLLRPIKLPTTHNIGGGEKTVETVCVT